MSTFETIALVLTIAATGGFLNLRFIGLPDTIGHMAFSLIVSITVVVLGKFGLLNLTHIQHTLMQIDFADVLLHGMLSFLLFAGALHINFHDLKAVRLPVAVMATFGVVVATFVTGTFVWFLAHQLGFQLPYLYGLLFGALISPTDPIAVLAILKNVGASKRIYVRIGSESLFNDGVGVVVFLTILGITLGTAPPTPSSLLFTLGYEAVGGAFFGSILGWCTYRLIRSINNDKIEILITLALASGSYVVAEMLHLSAPITVVAAGLLIGNHGRALGMSAQTRERLDSFWELFDEILNAVLFLFIGFELIIITLNWGDLILGLFATTAVLVGRYVSVSLPLIAFQKNFSDGPGTAALLTWGGLRGGISIALALSLPAGPEKEIILPITYIVVIFSILVQGLTFKKLILHLSKKNTALSA